MHFFFTLYTPVRSGALPGNEDSLLPTGVAGGLQDIRQDIFSQTNRYLGMLKQRPLVTSLALGQSDFLDSIASAAANTGVSGDLHEAFLGAADPFLGVPLQKHPCQQEDGTGFSCGSLKSSREQKNDKEPLS